MGGQTRYSRTTWKKNQLRQHMNTPYYGESACPLCEDGVIPDDLTLHVSKQKTCGDVHLELSLLRKYQATCTAGQAQYRDVCCPKQGGRDRPFTTTVALLAGLYMVWLVRKRLQARRRSIQDGSSSSSLEEEDSGTRYKQMTDDNNDRKVDDATSFVNLSRKRSKSKGFVDLSRQRSKTKKGRMAALNDDPGVMEVELSSRSRRSSRSPSKATKQLSPSRSRSRPKSRGRREPQQHAEKPSRSRERGLMARSRERGVRRPTTASRSRERPTSRSQTRRPRSRSRERPISRNRTRRPSSRSRERPSSRSRTRPTSRGRERRPTSRSRPTSSRGRERRPTSRNRRELPDHDDSHILTLVEDDDDDTTEFRIEVDILQDHPDDDHDPTFTGISQVV